jgi:hypothetical protein
MFNVPYKIRFQTLNSDSAVSVKYLISRNYYIQINKTWYYINVYTTIKGYLAVAWWLYQADTDTWLNVYNHNKVY